MKMSENLGVTLCTHIFYHHYRVTVRTYTWHRDSHGLFDYESRNITQNYLKCNYSGMRLYLKCIKVILYRYDNDIIFEEKRTGDKMPVDPAAIILEKDSKNCYIIISYSENYWFYHKGTVEDYE